MPAILWLLLAASCAALAVVGVVTWLERSAQLDRDLAELAGLCRHPSKPLTYDGRVWCGDCGQNIDARPPGGAA